MNTEISLLKKEIGKYYSYKRKEMLNFVPKSTKRILDVGCASGGFGSLLKIEQDREVWGIEINKEVAEEAKTKLDRVIIGDFENEKIDLPENYFDCVIFNDILEHFKDPWFALKKTNIYLKDTGFIVASIPNVRFYENVKGLIFYKKWTYVDAGILDKTHLRFFTMKSIVEMFHSCGYSVAELQGINGIEFPFGFRIINCMTMKVLFDDMRYNQFACIAKKVDN